MKSTAFFNYKNLQNIKFFMIHKTTSETIGVMWYSRDIRNDPFALVYYITTGTIDKIYLDDLQTKYRMAGQNKCEVKQ